MIHLDDADSQGIGGTGWRPFRARERRRLSRQNGKFPKSAPEVADQIPDYAAELTLHHQGFQAAITAYGQMLAKGHSEDQACRGALLAYQAYFPEDVGAADHVVDAILLAKEKLTPSV